MVYSTFPFKYGSPTKRGYFALKKIPADEIIAQVSYGGKSYEYSLSVRRTLRQEETRVLNYLTNKLLPGIGLGEFNLLMGENVPSTGYIDENSLVLGLQEPTVLGNVPQGYVNIHGYGCGASFRIETDDMVRRGRVSFI